MRAEIICVGTELLMGNILNTNAQYLAQMCAANGVDLYYQSVVGDNADRLRAAMYQATDRADLILVSGGLGPTEDDLTKETAAEVYGVGLHMDERTKERIRERLTAMGRTIAENNWKQAMIPDGAVILDNSNGTAPGIRLERDGVTMILLPGPPHELIPMVEEHVVPWIREQNSACFVSNMIKVTGIGESQAEMMIRDLIDVQTNPTIATYAKPGEVQIRLTAKAESEESAKALLKPVRKEIKSRFGVNIFTVKEEETLEMCVVRLLQKHGLHVTTVESCTGGLIASRIVNVPGSSEVLDQAFVTYANKAKHRLAGVKKSTLKEFGAVSEECVHEMAFGGADAAKAEACIAVSGIAGPGGGTDTKPVGLVYVGVCLDGETVVEECHFKGSRQTVRERTAIEGLDLLRRQILLKYENKE